MSIIYAIALNLFLDVIRAMLKFLSASAALCVYIKYSPQV